MEEYPLSLLADLARGTAAAAAAAEKTIAARIMDDIVVRYPVRRKVRSPDTEMPTTWRCISQDQ